MPVWEVSSLRKEASSRISFSRLLRPHRPGQRDALPGAGSPAASTHTAPRSHTSLHTSRGENHNAILQRDKSCAPATHAHPSFAACFHLVSSPSFFFFFSSTGAPRRGERAFSKSFFPREENKVSLNVQMFKSTLNVNTSTTKKAAFAFSSAGREQDQATKE